MAAGEPWAVTEARRRKAAEQFPVLGSTDAGDVLKVDDWGSQQGKPVTDFSQAAMRIAAFAGQQAPEDRTFEQDAVDQEASGFGRGPVQQSWMQAAKPFDYMNPQDVVNSPVGFEAGAPSSPVGETLRNVGGVFNPFSENSVFGSFYQGENPVLQELARPANYVGVGSGVRGLLRGAASGIGGRVAGEFAMDALPEDANPYLRAGVGLAAGLAGGVAGYRAVDDVPRLLGAADQALNPANLRPFEPRIGNAPGTDMAFTSDMFRNDVGPTGNVSFIEINGKRIPTPLAESVAEWNTQTINKEMQRALDNWRATDPDGFAEAQRYYAAKARPTVAGTDVNVPRGGADDALAPLTPDEFGALQAKRARGEALTPEETDRLMNAFGRQVGAMTDVEIAAAREAQYNGPLPDEGMTRARAGMEDVLRRSQGMATAETVTNDALRNARQGGGADVPPQGDVLAARIPNPLPSPVRARNTAAPEVGQRTGNLLRPRGLEQLGPDATVSDVIGVAQDTRRMVGSQQVALTSRAQTYLDALGPTVQDGAGNYRLRNVIKADGAPALMQDVLENPQRYPLTPEQARSVAEYQALVRDVHAEPQAFGVKVRTTDLEEGQGYVPRQAAKDAKGQELTRPGANSPGTRLRSMREQGRVFRDPEAAVRAGVVYEHPLTALQSYVRQNLEGAANQHIANMLKTFGETSAARVPAPLRAAHDGLMKSLSSLRQTVGRLDQRALETVEAHIASGADDLNALAADLNDIQVRGSGRNAGKGAAAVRAEIARVKQQIADMRPAWNRAQEQARQVPAGRARIDQQAAPALIGTDFAEADARRISRYYSNGILPQNRVGDVLRGLQRVNQAIVPMQAIGDASATLRQLGVVAPSKPITFARNFGKAGRDLFPGGQARYREWLASPEVQDAASRGVALTGHGGVPSDFYASWLERVPGLRQAQQHFEMITNRNRVDIFNQDVDMLRRTGQRVDDAAMEQVARNANRITGVSNNRATDAETLTQFAANWMRSRLETLTKALADGGIEGQLARSYLKNYVSVGLMAAGGAALAQGRDLRDVMNPIQERNGRFSYNPNFGTVRIGGVDHDMFGGFSDLARLAVMSADAGYGAIKERDLLELTKPLIYAARTKGAPWVTTGADVGTGENIIGEPTNTWTYWLTKPIPINAAQGVRQYQEGKPLVPSIVEQTAQFFGSRSNQLSPTERVQQGEFNDMSPTQQFKGLSAEAWRVIGGSSQAGSYSEWRARAVAEVAGELQRAGISATEAMQMAEEGVDRLPLAQAYSRYRNALETAWIAEHPKEAGAKFDAEMALPARNRRFSPTQQERGIIEAAR